MYVTMRGQLEARQTVRRLGYVTNSLKPMSFMPPEVLKKDRRTLLEYAAHV